MLFTSPVFIYVFLPVLLTAYLATPKKCKNTLLALASLFFYFWGEVVYAWVFILSVVFNYIAGLVLGSASNERQKNGILLAAVAANVGLLIYFKYANFIVDNSNYMLTAWSLAPWQLDQVHLPIGISFITFHAMSYLIDIKRGTSREQRNPLDVLLYLSLFPQLIAGPIVRYHQIAEQIKNRGVSTNGIYLGLRRFTFGLAKKVLIANQLGSIADSIFLISGNDINTPLAWLGITAYTLQLYFDFSGYSCMAIGLAMVFGFRFPENFNYPYISRSIQEFWRRWHISLSAWFRDYVYIPLGGSRKGLWRTYFNLLLVFFLCGLWHGAKWNFVVWGLFHGAFLVIERMGLARYLEQAWRPVSHAYTILVFMVAWVFFRADNLPHAVAYIQAMFGFGNATFNGDNAGYYLTHEVCAVFLAAIFLSTPVWQKADAVLQRRLSTGGFVAAVLQLADAIWMSLLLGVCLLLINEASYNPFIYFRF